MINKLNVMLQYKWKTLQNDSGRLKWGTKEGKYTYKEGYRWACQVASATFAKEWKGVEKWFAVIDKIMNFVEKRTH